MNVVIHGIGWGILAAAMMLSMKAVARKRGAKETRRSWRTGVMCLILVAVSVLEGCRIATRDFLIAEEVRLTISYFLILGAAVIDEKMRIIPNFIPGIMVLSSLVIVAIKALMGGNVGTDLAGAILGALLCGVVLGIADKASKGGIGKGDIKLLMAHGFLCGTNIVFSTLLLALLCCAVFSAGMVLLKKCTAKDHLAFGPFLYVGYAVMLFFTIY